MNNRLTTEQFAFVRYLTALNTDANRGTLAVLRRGLSGDPVEDLNMYRFVAPRVPESERGTHGERVYYLTAALYALHPENAATGNFGDHMKRVALQRKDQDAAERRFTALLNTRLEDLNTPLRQAVVMLRQVEPPIAVNWMALFADLLWWDHPRKYVQRAWANGFWSYESPEQSIDNQSTETQQGE
jgi:CRISPR system Cascade subunit CasB